MEKGFWFVVHREIGRMVRRPIYLMMTVIIPLLIIIFFATFLNQGVPKQMPIAVVDFDNSSLSRTITRNLSAGEICNIKYRLSSYESAKAKMRQGQIYAFVVIPRDFEKNVYNRKSPIVNFYTEYAHYLCASLMMKEINTTLTTLSLGVDLKMRLAKGEDASYAEAKVNPVSNDAHVIANPLLNYAFYLSSVMMPGIIGLMVMLCTIYAIGIELKNYSSRRWMVCAKKNIAIAIDGKMLPYTIIYTLVIIFAETVMENIMGFPSEGNPWIMYLGALFTIISYQAVGIFLLGVIPSLRTALSIATIYGVMSFTLTGFTYPNEAMLPAVRPFTFIYPLRQYYQLYCNVQINGLGFVETLMPFVFLMIFWILPFFIIMRLRSAAVLLNYERD